MTYSPLSGKRWKKSCDTTINHWGTWLVRCSIQNGRICFLQYVHAESHTIWCLCYPVIDNTVPLSHCLHIIGFEILLVVLWVAPRLGVLSKGDLMLLIQKTLLGSQRLINDDRQGWLWNNHTTQGQEHKGMRGIGFQPLSKKGPVEACWKNWWTLEWVGNVGRRGDQRRAVRLWWIKGEDAQTVKKCLKERH